MSIAWMGVKRNQENQNMKQSKAEELEIIGTFFSKKKIITNQ